MYGNNNCNGTRPQIYNLHATLNIGCQMFKNYNGNFSNLRNCKNMTMFKYKMGYQQKLANIWEGSGNNSNPQTVKLE